METIKALALKINLTDNVASIFSDVAAEEAVEVADRQGKRRRVKANQSIPYGHKIALEAIKKGGKIIKYGEEIGIASRDISIGDYVHVHNLDSARGRGDLGGMGGEGK